MAIQFSIPFAFSVGAPIVSSQHNANWQKIQEFVNQLQAGQNFNDGAIGTQELEDGSVTSGKLAASLSLTTPILNVASATSIAVSGSVVYHMGTTSVGAGYTLLNSDDGKIIEMSSTSSLTLTVPTDTSMGTNTTFGGLGIPTGGQITIIQTNVGQVSVTGAVGVTIFCTPQTTANIGKLRTRWSAATLLKRGTDSWILMGDLTA